MPSNYKPLTFNTSIRNPERAKYFLKTIIKFENEIMTNDLAKKIMVEMIKDKIYRPDQSLNVLPNLKEKFKSFEALTHEDAKSLLQASEQDHLDGGFEWGWPSRFYTMYALLRKFGLLWWEKPELNKPLLISKIGKNLAECVPESTLNKPHPWKFEEDTSPKEQAIFCSLLSKYQRKNPFTAELNHNCPLSLLLRVIKLINEHYENSNGLSFKEIPFLLVWKNNNAEEIFDRIKTLRSSFNEITSDIILNSCDEYTEGRYASWQDGSLSTSVPDDYIRKMTLTDLIIVRGGGDNWFLDLNRSKLNIIEHVISNYSTPKNFNNEKEYYEYASIFDPQLIEFEENIYSLTSDDKLLYWANLYGWSKIKDELKLVQRRRISQDPRLRILSNAKKLEFLISLALKLKWKEYVIKPNYKVDHEGMIRQTAPSRMSDIVCEKDDIIDLVEVTMLQDGHGQGSIEIPKIRRHVNDKKTEFPNSNVSSTYITPRMHEDALFLIRAAGLENVIIKPFDIGEFIQKLETNSVLN